MKAEHRKELHTNALANQMGRLVQGVRSNPKSNSIVALAIAGLALGTFLVWYLASGSAAADSGAWIGLYDDTRLNSLEHLANANKGTLPARTAQFQRARICLQRGTE